jgi:hypothetical protein
MLGGLAGKAAQICWQTVRLERLVDNQAKLHMLAGLEDQVDDQAALIDRLARLHMIGPKVGMAGCTGLV